MKLSALYQIFLDCQLVTTDSRNCPEGSLFIALKGESFNGNAFAGKALETGCAYAVIDDIYSYTTACKHCSSLPITTAASWVHE